MHKQIEDFRHNYLSQALLLRASLVKFFKNVSNSYEEEQRKLKYNEDLTARIAAAESQIASVLNEEARIQEEKKKVTQKNSELNAKLKRESSKVEDLQLTVDRERARKFYISVIVDTFSIVHKLKTLLGIEEQERVAKNVQDRANLLLKPYHEILGVTFQLSKEPEVSLRILFQMPNSKKCVVKLNKNGLKGKYLSFLQFGIILLTCNYYSSCQVCTNAKGFGETGKGVG